MEVADVKQFEEGLISIIVPVHNSSATLEKCVETIVGQTYKNIEIILINNGSQDNSLELCRQLAKKDNRIIVLNLEEGNVSKARNAALEIMHGEYFAFVDSDDYVDLTMYEKLYSKATESCANMVFCRYYESYSDKTVECIEKRLEDVVLNKKFQYFFVEGEDYVKGIIWRAIYKSSVYGEVRFKTNIYYGEDFEYLSNLLIISDNTALVNEYLYFYTISQTYTSKKYFSDRIIENDRVYAQSCSRFLKAYGIDDYASAVIYKSWIHIVHSYLAYSDNYKSGLKIIKNDEYWREAKSKKNYRMFLKYLCPSFKYRLRAFLLEHYMLHTYRFLIKSIV